MSLRCTFDTITPDQMSADGVAPCFMARFTSGWAYDSGTKEPIFDDIYAEDEGCRVNWGYNYIATVMLFPFAHSVQPTSYIEIVPSMFRIPELDRLPFNDESIESAWMEVSATDIRKTTLKYAFDSDTPSTVPTYPEEGTASWVVETTFDGSLALVAFVLDGGNLYSRLVSAGEDMVEFSHGVTVKLNITNLVKGYLGARGAAYGFALAMMPGAGGAIPPGEAGQSGALAAIREATYQDDTTIVDVDPPNGAYFLDGEITAIEIRIGSISAANIVVNLGAIGALDANARVAYTIPPVQS